MPVDHEPWGSPAPAYQESVLDHWRSPDDEVSDWQAAWEGGQGEPDPRIGRPKRTGSLFALLLAVVAVAATRPWSPSRSCWCGAGSHAPPTGP